MGIKKPSSRKSAFYYLGAFSGLATGLIFAAILALPLSLLAGPYNKVLPLIFAVLFGGLGAVLFALKMPDFFTLSAHPEKSEGGYKIILDTSAIIDGRIADISQTGFLQGTLILPRFVLNELQHIADSTDDMRRKRGRRGLDMLNRIQKETGVPVEILDTSSDDNEPVDSRLVKLAKQLDGPIVTSDFNLNKVAEIQGVKVLNINELATAVRPLVLPGEEMEVRIIQEGKEFGQGVAFMDDGTMVVVEGGRKYLNNKIDIVVTRVLQTAAGRMIFAQLKNGAR